MKKMMILAMMMVMTVSANAMNYTTAKNEALFLSDKMAFELNLTDAQYEAVYEINLDYLLSVNGQADVFGIWWNRRNTDLRFVLNGWQYEKYAALNYFYRPIYWDRGAWTFHIYNRYTNRSHFYKPRPAVFVTYKGGNNRRTDNFYASHRVTKPAAHDNGRNWRTNGNVKVTAQHTTHNGNVMARSTARNENAHPAGNRQPQVAHAGRR